jgi:V/A-type H+-transporting ATPase subunit K
METTGMNVEEFIKWIGTIGAFGISSLGAGIACAVVGTVTIGAWKKCLMQNKPVPFILVAFAGMPLSNVIYGFILMNTLVAAVAAGVVSAYKILAIGILGGIGIGTASVTQAMCSACASEAYAETGQGFGNYMMVIGICETVALFVMVFSMLQANAG